MKEFKDAKKAMEKAQEEERKKAGSETSSGDVGRSNMRGKKAQPLLKAAILNNAREKDVGAG
jgi:hypothetical protein